MRVLVKFVLRGHVEEGDLRITRAHHESSMRSRNLPDIAVALLSIMGSLRS